MAGYAFWPALAPLRAELRFSYTLLGVYSALWSVGATLVGVSFAVILLCVLGAVVSGLGDILREVRQARRFRGSG